MRKGGEYRTTSGQSVKIYGPSRHRPGYWVGVINGAPTIYEWDDAGRMDGMPDLELVK